MEYYCQHPSEDEIEHYLLGNMSTNDMGFVEEHYLACPECDDRVSRMEVLIADIKRVQPRAIPRGRASIAMIRPSTAPGAEAAPDHTHYGGTAAAAALVIGLGLGMLQLTGPQGGSQASVTRTTVRNLERQFVASLGKHAPDLEMESTEATYEVEETPQLPQRAPARRFLRPTRMFQPPPERQMHIVDAALVDPPSLKMDAVFISAAFPVEFDLTEIPSYHAPKPNRFRRILGAISAPFRALGS